MAAESFVTNMEDHRTWAMAAAIPVVVGTAGAAIPELLAVGGGMSMMGEGVELTSFALAVEGSGAATVVETAAVGGEVATVGTAGEATVGATTVATIPTAAAVGGGSTTSAALTVGLQSTGAGAAGAALNALTDSGITAATPTQTLAASLSDSTYFHYTDAAGYQCIMADNAIRANAQNKIYFTQDMVSPSEAYNALFAGNPNFAEKGTHMIAIDGTGLQLTPGTQPNEMIHLGTVRLKDRIIFGGLNPFQGVMNGNQ